MTVSNVAMSSEGGESKRSVPRSGPRPSPRVGGSGSAGANVGRGSGSGSHGGRRTLAKAGSSHVIRIAERRQSTVVKLRTRKSSRRLKVAPAAEEPGVTWVSLCIICVSIWLGLGAMSAAALRAYTEAIDMANEQMLDALGGNVAQEIGGSGTAACSCVQGVRSLLCTTDGVPCCQQCGLSPWERSLCRTRSAESELYGR